MKRRDLLLAALAAAALPLRADEAFDTLDLDWIDEMRQRPVPVRLYRPRAEGPWPLVVFSHGIGGSRLGYAYLGRHFAANGIASLHLQHVGSDRRLWGGNVFGLVGRLQAAAQDSEAVARVRDLGFALDHLLAGPLGEPMDPTHIVAAGHSYGANTALLAAGATVQRAGGAVALRDPRVAAAIAISAPPFYGESDLTPILGGIELPSLHVTTTEDVIRIPGYYSAAEDRLAVFDAIGSRSKYLAQFNQGRHGTFVGRGGEADPVLVATRELALAFVQRSFGLPGGDLAGWHDRHQGIVERFVPGPAARQTARSIAAWNCNAVTSTLPRGRA